jgi:hypothetical protein
MLAARSETCAQRGEAISMLKGRPGSLYAGGIDRIGHQQATLLTVLEFGSCAIISLLASG